MEARVASVEIDNWSGHQFTDCHSPLNFNGEWQIISKVFYLHGWAVQAN